MSHFKLVAVVALFATVSACSSNLDLSADVEYRSDTCAGLGREFGRYLDDEIRHIEERGEAKYVVAQRDGLPVIRDLLDAADDPAPEDERSLLFFAPVGHLLELGEVIRDRELPCTTQEMAAASDGEVSDKVKATLLRNVQLPPPDSERAPTWEDWWRLYGGTAVSTPAIPPGTGVSRP